MFSFWPWNNFLPCISPLLGCWNLVCGCSNGAIMCVWRLRLFIAIAFRTTPKNSFLVGFPRFLSLYHTFFPSKSSLEVDPEKKSPNVLQCLSFCFCFFFFYDLSSIFGPFLSCFRFRSLFWENTNFEQFSSMFFGSFWITFIPKISMKFCKFALFNELQLWNLCTNNYHLFLWPAI